MNESISEPELESLIKSHGQIISRLSHRMIQNNELANEAAQEVWIEIINSLHTFKGNSKVSTWMYIIAKRTILRYAKAERIYKEKEINAHFELEPIEYKGLEEGKKEWVKEKCDYCLTAFCHCLNNESRLIFLFRELADLSYSQISEIMEINEDNIRQILSRSKEKVKNFMSKNCVIYNPEGSCKCRIRKHVISVNLDKEYSKLAKAAQLVDLFQKFDKELPRKNYWEKIVAEVVTN
jgi:RNA polymerase sigma factor (sigma-70 family)